MFFQKRDLENADFKDNNDFTMKRVRRLKEDALHWALAIRQDQLQRSMLEAELRYREARPARIAVGLSVIAIIISLVALGTDLNPYL